MKLRARDVLILASLASCYACHYGILSCLGLYQEVWCEHLNFSAKEVAWISGLTLSLFRIPSPLIEFLLQWFKIPPYVQLGTAGLLISGGMMALGSTTTLSWVLVVSVLGLGLGCSLSLLSTYTSMYLFFKDKQIPVFMSIITSGAGLAVIAIALVFEWLQSSASWQFAFRYQSLLGVPYLFAAVVLCPRINRRLSTADKQNCYNISMASVVLDGKQISTEKQLCTPELKVKPTDVTIPEETEEEENEIEVETEQSQISEIHASWKNVLFNRSFLLLLASWVLVGGSVRACMVHEPQRIVHLGYSMKNGADSLAINGAVQFASRKSQLVFLSSKSRSNLSINLGLTVGLLASANLISIIRLSQLSKIFLSISTFVSAFYTNLAVQHGYMFMLGIGAGVTDTIVVILVKECMEKERDIAISILIFVDAVSVLIATTSAGYFVDMFQNYQIVFAIYGTCFMLGAFLCILMEVSIKMNKKQSKKVCKVSETYEL